MTGFRIEKHGEAISSVEEWFRLAPPKKGLVQWRDGRSAKELARRWVTGVPTGVGETLSSHEDLADLQLLVGEPEVSTAFDEFRAPREHDLLVSCQVPSGNALLAIEGKADESFDDLVHERLRRNTAPTNFPERLRRLSLALFGDPNPEFLGQLRYQLVQATVASVLEAQRRDAQAVVLLIHVFQTDQTRPELIARNAEDLDAFVRALTVGGVTSMPAQSVVGPMNIPGYGLVKPGTPLYIGKAVTDLRS